MPESRRIEPLDYAGTLPLGSQSPRSISRGLWIMLVLSIGLLLLFAILLPSRGRAREPANQIKCKSNLRSIVAHCQLYANINAGLYPQSFGVLIVDTDLLSEILICPSSNNERAEGPSTRAVASAIDSASPKPSGSVVSYFYVGKSLTDKSPATAVVAYEPPHNHNGAGGHVAFADGQVIWYDATQLAKLTAAVQAGINPPPPIPPIAPSR